MSNIFVKFIYNTMNRETREFDNRDRMFRDRENGILIGCWVVREMNTREKFHTQEIPSIIFMNNFYNFYEN